MNEKLKGVLITAGVVAALGGGGAAIAGATGGGDDNGSEDAKADTPIAGSALGKAREAALAHTGGGKVTGTEAGDEEGAYEVEVTRADGSQVDVHLNKQFDVLDSKADGGERGEEGPNGDGDGEHDDD
ncbi:MAG: hypothetical protein AABM31_00525 [Actinomycetota bacterium]